MAKNNKRKTVVVFDNDEGVRVRLVVETFNNNCLTYTEQKNLQDSFVDAAVFAVRAAPYLGCPAVQRMKIT